MGDEDILPPLKEKRFTTTVIIILRKIEFQLAPYSSFPNSMTEDKMGNWLTVSQAC